MSQRYEGELWTWLRLAWDKPAGAVATFVLGALLFGPVPFAFEAYTRSRAVGAEPMSAMVWSAFADATVHLLPVVQTIAALLMLVALVAAARHVRRRPRNRPRSRRARKW